MTAPQPRTLRALVVGESGVPLQCAQLLLRRGHHIVGMVSPDPEVREWAAARGIRTLQPSDDVGAFAREQSYDYLFSIVNYALLPVDVLQSAQVAAINYHDAPLPRYAGVYATTWALLNDESEHGVTWHVMVEEVDAGDILRQEAVPILPRDTVASLNVRCFFTAVRAFRDLLAELEAGRLMRTPQDLSRRTYYGLSRRPPDLAVLRWTRPVEQLDRLVRAIDFGTHRNPIALPKVVFPHGVFAIRSLEAAEASAAAPGTIVMRTDDTVRIACTGGDAVVGGFHTLHGEPVSIETVLAGISDGERISEPAAPDLSAAHAFGERVAPHERFWVARLALLSPADGMPHAQTTTLRDWPAGRIELSAPVQDERWVAALVAALNGVSGLAEQSAAIGLGWSALHEHLDALGPLGDALFLRWVPAHVRGLTDVGRELAVLRRRETFARDVLARTAARGTERALTPSAWSRVAVLLERDSSTAALRPPAECALLIRIVEGGRAAEWMFDEHALPLSEIRAMRDSVSRALAHTP